MIRLLVRSLAVVVLALAVLASGESELSAGVAGQGAGTLAGGDCPICTEAAPVESCIPVSCPAAAFFAVTVIVPRRDESAPVLAHERKEQGIALNLDPPPPKSS